MVIFPYKGGDNLRKSLREYLIQQEHFRKIMSRNYTQAQQYYDIMNQSQLQEYYRQADLISQSKMLFNNTISTEANTIYNSVNPIVEALNNQLELINKMNVTNYDNFYNWNSIVSNLINSPSINLNDSIPDSFYDFLEDIDSELKNSLHFHESDDDVLSEITVRKTVEAKENKMSWSEFFGHILVIITLIYTIYDSNSNSLEFEEELIEMEKQTQLLERQIDIQEQILIDSQSKYEEQLEINKDVEEKLDLLLKNIESFMDDSIDQDEDSLE